MSESSAARFVARWELAGVRGTVVAIDVIRAFTTAAYAFGAGAKEIWLVDEVDEALALGRSIPGALIMGEDHGRRPAGFDFSNSPVAVAAADLDGRSMVQRTSAGTRGAVAAIDAERLFVASLVCAGATARAINAAGLGAPTYVITGRFPDAPDNGFDDLVTAEFIEQLRLAGTADAVAVAAEVAGSDEAGFTLAIGGEHVHADDIAYATDVDRFDFAMEVERIDGRLRVRRHYVS
jgi:2-phosphosulfolactate phosphatase